MAKRVGRATPLEIALKYIERGWSPLPIAYRCKNCTVTGWPTLRITREEAPQYFHAEKQNVGVLLGEASGNLVDVDIDDRRFALQLAPMFLPATGAQFGRAGKPGSHWLYVAAEPSAQYTKPERLVQPGEKAMIVELRSTRLQTVFPGSTHESGESIEWDSDREPAAVEPAALRAAVGRLAAASLLASVWVEGTRNVITAALRGVLSRTWPLDQVTDFVGAIAQVAGDDAARREERVARPAQPDAHEFGWPELRRRLGDDVVDLVARWLDLGTESGIDELNREYAIVPVGSRVMILRQSEDRDYPGTLRTDYWRQADFNLQLANQSVQVGDREIPLARAWIASPHRRQYSGVVFEPGSTDTGNYFNLWTKWAVTPRAGGSWGLLRQHIYENVVNGNERAGDWLIRWMADVVQHPNRPNEISVVLRGGKGVGKGTVWKAFGRLFGRHYVQLTDARHLVGNFNAQLIDKVFIFVDEGFFAGDKRHAAVLKGMITEPRVVIEPKGVDAFSVPNYRHIAFASNEDWVVPAGLDERRFAVFDVHPRHAQDRKYFGAIDAELNAGGYEAMMHELSTLDLSGFEVTRVPRTAALFEQKRLSFDEATAFWFDRLISGEILPGERSSTGVFLPGRPWDDGVRTDELAAAFVKSISNPYERRAAETKLGAALKRLCPHRRIVRKHLLGGERPRHYNFPPLDECRQAFEHAVGTRINWLSGNAIESDEP